MDKFADIFVDIYAYYEVRKSAKGIDYADMLIKFLKMKSKPKYV